MTDTETLIARLEEATEGGREWDWWIAYQQGHPSMNGARVADDGSIGFLPFTPDSNADNAIPHYTTSLDAKLPWEDIEMVSHQTTGRWCALQRQPKRGAKHEAAYGHTEALARRIAALKARARSLDMEE